MLLISMVSKLLLKNSEEKMYSFVVIKIANNS